MITFVGVTRADDTLVLPLGQTGDGTPIFQRGPYGFSLVVEARPGGTRAEIGSRTFNWNPSDPTLLPDLQVEVSRNLGNGSLAVCDDMAPLIGGVPAVDPPTFSPLQSVADAINDLSCRFKDGTGTPGGRGPSDACVLYPDGQFRFASPDSTLEFCGQIIEPLHFPVGDTMVTVRVRDVDGHISAPAQLIIRVGAL